MHCNNEYTIGGSLVVGLVGAVDRETDVFRLFLSESSELDAKLSDVGTSNFLVETLRKHVDAKRELLRSGPECNLSEDLVGERARHDKGWVTSSTSAIRK